jgi:hypothetical protein
MKTVNQFNSMLLLAVLTGVFSISAQAGLISNGNFESGFAGWTIADQPGSDGTFFVQTGTSSPANGFSVPAPPQGSNAAMTDSGAGGSHVLYQDFIVPISVGSANVGFSLFLNNGADNFYNPGNLDWAATNTQGSLTLNQQARVDILSTSADVFGMTVLQNLFQTNPGGSLVSGYDSFLVDITALLQAHPGETLRLRFAETDNVSFLNLGVDDVNLSIPEPTALIMTFGGLAGLVWLRRRRGESRAG